MSSRRSRYLVIAVAVGAVAAMWWLGDGCAERSRKSDTRATSTTERGAAPRRARDAGTQPSMRAMAWLLPAPRHTRRVAGIVLHDGVPAQAEVQMATRAFKLGVVPGRIVHTGADGRFDLGEVPVEPLQLRARAGTATGFAEIDLAREPAPDHLTLHVSACASETLLRVVDTGGTPIPEAVLTDTSGFVVATTRADGSARLCSHEAPALRVSADGYGSQRLSMFSIPSTVTLTPEAVMTGNVVDEGGRAVADALVFTVPSLDRIGLDHVTARTVSGTDGRFELRGLSPGPIRVTARVRGATATPVDVSVEVGKPAEVTLVVVPGVTVRGSIQSGGRPMANTRLVLHDRAGISHGLTSDEHGNFEVEGVSVGVAKLLNAASAIKIVSRRDLVVAAGMAPLVIELAPVVDITARVLDDGPVPGAIVQPRCEPEGGDFLQRTGPDGQATLRVPPGSSCDLVATVDLRRIGTSARFDAGPPAPATITITLPPRIRNRVHGQVLDAAGAPVSGISIRLRGDGGEHLASSGNDGRWELRSIAPGAYAIIVYAGLDDVPADIVPDRVTMTGAGQDVPIQIRTRSRPHRLTGTVVDARRQPVADATISAISMASPFAHLPTDSASMFASSNTVSDGAGAFTITLFTLGKYRLDAHAASGTGTTTVDVPASAPVMIELSR